MRAEELTAIGDIFYMINIGVQNLTLSDHEDNNSPVCANAGGELHCSQHTMTNINFYKATLSSMCSRYS